MIKNLLITLSIFSMISCAQNEFSEIEGHWRSIGLNSCYETLDIADSTVILNKIDRNGYCMNYQIYRINDTLTFIPFEYYTFRMVVDSVTDTLYISEYDGYDPKDYITSKWIKTNRDIKDVDREFNCRLLVSVELEINNESVPFDTIGLNYNWTIINIGLPSSEKYKEWFGDSLRIQMNSAIGNSSEVTEFLNAERELYSDEDNELTNDLVLIINADKNVSVSYINKIVTQTKSLDFVKNIYQTCINQDKMDIGLYKVR